MFVDNFCFHFPGTMKQNRFVIIIEYKRRRMQDEEEHKTYALTANTLL